MTLFVQVDPHYREIARARSWLDAANYGETTESRRRYAISVLASAKRGGFFMGTVDEPSAERPCDTEPEGVA